MTTSDIDIPNACCPEAGVTCGGQPTPEQMADAAARGVRTVVNLRPPEELDWDEEAVVREHGMDYVCIPVAGPDDLSEANIRSLSEVLSDRDRFPVVIHCGSGNRVGALYALKKHRLDRCGVDEALAAGKAAGLTGLEAYVRSCLGAR